MCVCVRVCARVCVCARVVVCCTCAYVRGSPGLLWVNYRKRRTMVMGSSVCVLACMHARECMRGRGRRGHACQCWGSPPGPTQETPTQTRVIVTKFCLCLYVCMRVRVLHVLLSQVPSFLVMKRLVDILGSCFVLT